MGGRKGLRLASKCVGANEQKLIDAMALASKDLDVRESSRSERLLKFRRRRRPQTSRQHSRQHSRRLIGSFRRLLATARRAISGRCRLIGRRFSRLLIAGMRGRSKTSWSAQDGRDIIILRLRPGWRGQSARSLRWHRRLRSRRRDRRCRSPSSRRRRRAVATTECQLQRLSFTTLKTPTRSKVSCTS